MYKGTLNNSKRQGNEMDLLCIKRTIPEERVQYKRR
jgi:hypothetical protein